MVCNKKFILAAALLSCVSCAFRVPTAAEQQKLAESGAFASGTPAWVTGVSAPDRADAGSIPQKFTAAGFPLVADDSAIGAQRSEMVTSPKDSGEIDQGGGSVEDSPSSSPLSKSPVSGGPQDSPLSRIEALCPNVEEDVRKALTNVVLDERLSMYVSLSRRCPQSGDIWGWLAKDHLEKGNSVSAKTAAERALSIDQKNGDAAAVLAELGRSAG